MVLYIQLLGDAVKKYIIIYFGDLIKTSEVYVVYARLPFFFFFFF